MPLTSNANNSPKGDEHVKSAVERMLSGKATITINEKQATTLLSYIKNILHLNDFNIPEGDNRGLSTAQIVLLSNKITIENADGDYSKQLQNLFNECKESESLLAKTLQKSEEVARKYPLISTAGFWGGALSISSAIVYFAAQQGDKDSLLPSLEQHASSILCNAAVGVIGLLATSISQAKVNSAPTGSALMTTTLLSSMSTVGESAIIQHIESALGSDAINKIQKHAADAIKLQARDNVTEQRIECSVEDNGEGSYQIKMEYTPIHCVTSDTSAINVIPETFTDQISNTTFAQDAKNQSISISFNVNNVTRSQLEQCNESLLFSSYCQGLVEGGTQYNSKSFVCNATISPESNPPIIPTTPSPTRSENNSRDNTTMLYGLSALLGAIALVGFGICFKQCKNRFDELQSEEEQHAVNEYMAEYEQNHPRVHLSNLGSAYNQLPANSLQQAEVAAERKEEKEIDLEPEHEAGRIAYEAGQREEKLPSATEIELAETKNNNAQLQQSSPSQKK